jgi:DNA polymerase-3 subunit delta
VRYINNPFEETVLIITAPYSKLDERKAITKALKGKAEVVFCEPMKKVDLTSWIRRQLGKQGIKIDKKAMDEFLKRVENNTQIAVNEMKKLLLYAEGMDYIYIDTIKKVITKNVEDNVYEITNNILENKRSEALEIYNDLIMHSEDPLRILGILVNKYREILLVKLLLKDGKDQSGVAAHYRCSSGRAYYMVKNARSVNMGTVKKHLIRLEELDHQIKSGRIDKKIGIELFILGT